MRFFIALGFCLTAGAFCAPASAGETAVGHGPMVVSSNQTPSLRDPNFFRRVRVFLGGARGRYVLRGNRSVYDSFGMATSLGGSDSFRTESGVILYECQHHECDVKGAVLVDKTDAISAVGLLHFACYERDHPRCQDRPRLSVFLRRSPRAAKLVGEMQRWGRAQQTDIPELQVVWLPGPKTAVR